MKTVLIVDDKPEVRELIEVTLRIGDYQFLTAASGQEAVQVVQEKQPDLVIMDVMMPGDFDGLEAVKRIRQDDANEGVRVVMLSAKSGAGDIDAGMKAGADAYLTKPFGPLDLMRTVDRVMSQRR